MARRTDGRSEDRRRFDRWLAVAIAFVAVCLGVAGFAAAQDTRTLSTRGVTVSGTIVKYTGLKTARVVVEFDTADGRQVRATTSEFLEAGDPGEPLLMVYDPEDPQLVRAADWGVDYTDAVLLTALSALCVGLAAVTWRYGVPACLRPANWSR